MERQFLLVAQPLAVMRIAGLRIFNHRETVFQTQPVTGPAQGEAGAEEVPVLVLPIHPGGIEDDMRMDMRMVDVRCHNELMLTFCPAHRQLVADLLGLLRRHFAGLEGLPDLIQQHIRL